MLDFDIYSTPPILVKRWHGAAMILGAPIGTDIPGVFRDPATISFRCIALAGSGEGYEEEYDQKKGVGGDSLQVIHLKLKPRAKFRCKYMIFKLIKMHNK